MVTHPSINQGWCIATTFIDSNVLPLNYAPPPKNKPQHFLLCINSEAISHYVYISKYTRVRVAVLSLEKCSAIELLCSMCMKISNTVQLDTGTNVFNPLQWLNNTVQHLLTKFKCMPAVILPSSTSRQEKFTSEYSAVHEKQSCLTHCSTMQSTFSFTFPAVISS